ncbi:MAG TPA: hypothetical protein VMW26_06765 [Methanomassiliicoccales archaeon]|nr:hypothetical protein [Methanomassiliicoccales archaeon]
MRYCYCPECDKLHPKNWYSRNKCEICRGKCTIIEVNRTIYGFLMYLLDAVAAFFIGIYLFADSLTGALGEFVQSLGIEGITIVIFALIGASVVFGYFDLKETTRRAELKVHQIRMKKLDQSL